MGYFTKTTEKFNYGWVVTVGCMLVYVYGLGLTSNTISMFVEPLILALNITKTQGSSLMTAQYALAIVGLLVGGQYYKAHSTRIGVFFCGLMISFGYFSLSLARNLWLCYLAMAFIGFGYGGGVFVPSSLLITRWFHQRRGVALSIAACGSGIATILYPPILERLLSNYSLVAALWFQSGSILLFAAIAFALLRDSPSEIGLLPYGAETGLGTGKCAPAPREETIPWSDLLWDKRVRLLCASVVLSGMVTIPVIAHLKPFYTSSGYDSMVAAKMVSLHGFCMLIGKPVFGEIVDRLNTRKANAYIYAVTLLALCFGLVLRRGIVFAYLYPFLMGLSSALSPMATPLWAADVYGGKYYAQIYTCTRIGFTLGGTVSMALPGMVADFTGSYTLVLWIYLVLLMLSYILLRRAYAMIPVAG